jgi:hypothetical protein
LIGSIGNTSPTVIGSTDFTAGEVGAWAKILFLWWWWWGFFSDNFYDFYSTFGLTTSAFTTVLLSFLFLSSVLTASKALSNPALASLPLEKASASTPLVFG